MRPDNWNERRKKAVTELGMLPPQTEFPIMIPDSFDWFRLKSQLYEAGADAMLEALKAGSMKAGGTLMTPEQMKLIVPDREYPYGWLVFIPEDA